jgi:response regulator RpfG family c-di-GMP phosphodiesterase
MSMVELTRWTYQLDNDSKMLRVLMVLEDYGELMFLQTVLKKIGFDVDAIQNPRSFQESLLRMNPDVLVMTAHGKRVNGVNLVKTVKKIRGLPKILLLRGPNAIQDPDTEIDMWRETPLGARELLGAIAELCNLDKQMLQEKFQKLHLQEVEQEHARILKINEIAEPSLNKGGDTGNFGMLKASSMPAEERKQRYDKFLKGEAPEKHGFSVKQVQEQVKALRKEETTEELDELERQRRAFVEHLFKKKAT